jgi:hypothetical protein
MEASTAKRLRLSVGRGVGRADGARMGQRPVTPMVKVLGCYSFALERWSSRGGWWVRGVELKASRKGAWPGCEETRTSCTSFSSSMPLPTGVLRMLKFSSRSWRLLVA